MFHLNFSSIIIADLFISLSLSFSQHKFLLNSSLLVFQLPFLRCQSIFLFFFFLSLIHLISDLSGSIFSFSYAHQFHNSLCCLLLHIVNSLVLESWMIVVFSLLLSLLKVWFKSINIYFSLLLLVLKSYVKCWLKLFQMINSLISSQIIQSHLFKNSEFCIWFFSLRSFFICCNKCFLLFSKLNFTL